MREQAENVAGPLWEGYESALEELAEGHVLERIWERDSTVWRDDPREIDDRLGWLGVADAMVAEVPALEAFAAEVRAAGIADVVLLGMGGSSLGAEAVRAALAPAAGPLRLQILDSTVPARVARVAGALDPATTLFLVASKSGGTTEVQALFDFFWDRAAAAGPRPGRQFAAITDPSTSLARLAEERSFRRTWLNPADIGGRFSALSYFGLLPAALAGVDLPRLLERARRAERSCGPGVPAALNPAARLGAFLGAGARQGRDKATLLCPPPLEPFGLWIEQLVAESTGKDGTGVLPVTAEPWAGPESYGPDRLFVALGLAGAAPGSEASVAERAAALANAGQPLLELALADPYDLGEQLFVWQLGTAVAGHLLGIHPFDQPDVQAAKDRTRELLARYLEEGALPEPPAGDDLVAELARERPSYVALLAYLDASSALERAVAELRRALLETLRLPTTFGYGPRYLHSTGQYHKGGPAGGLHVVLTSTEAPELPIPGRPYGFETLAAAQAAGDLQALAQASRRAVAVAVDPQRAADQLAELAERVRRGGGDQVSSR